MLRGRVAVITGASRGLGLAVARLYAEEGARLALVARGREALRRAADELSTKTDVLALDADVGEHAERIAADALRRFGRVDILINNASELGPVPMPTLDSYPWDALMRVLRVNAVAPLHLAQQLLPSMRARKDGVIVNVTSDAGVQAYPGWGGYGASKAALEHLSRVMAAELDGSGIRIVVVDPGDMDTQMHRDAEPGVDLSHLPGPEAIAPAFVRLIDDGPEGFARIEARALLPAAARAG